MAALTAILVVNAGSSSLKLRLLSEADAVLGSADLPAPRGAADAAGLKTAIGSLGQVDAVGHRIVHGGNMFAGPVLIDPGVRQRLESLTDLAPLHQPKSLATLDAVQAVLPDVPAVGCFDTAFHATIGPAAATFGLPAEWRERWTLRRYGFHGLSHAYVSRRAAELAGAPSRVISCHLGAGASLAAIAGGRSVDTTMGFTPLDGLVMATRSGSVDPGLLMWLEQHAGIPPAELAATLEYRSGLYGLAGTGDMREVLARAAAGDPRASLAREVYLHRFRASVAAMAAAMDGLDALVFTGGVGENSAEIRSRAMAGLGFLGVREDAARNANGPGDREIGAAGAPVRSLVIAAREDLEITRQVRDVLARLPARRWRWCCVRPAGVSSTQMAELIIDDWDLVVRLTLGEKIWGLHGDIRIRLPFIASVAPDPKPWTNLRGWRMAGISFRGSVALGTRRHGIGYDFVVLHGDRPAVQVNIASGRFSRLVISVPEDGDPEAEAARIAAAAGITPSAPTS